MMPYEQRVVDEEADLAIRIEALKAFMAKVTFTNIARGERELMIEQLGHMEKYRDTLQQRIALIWR